jgi:hypothetical protein
LKLLFLDESGDHSLDKIDPTYPVFVLGGLIVDEQYADSVLSERVRRLKIDLFGRDGIILRTADIRRNRNGFEALKDAGFRQRFYSAINELMRDLDYQVAACAILKDDHLRRYGVSALDPYLLSLNVVIERFCFEFGGNNQIGKIIAERRNPVLDKQLDLAWRNLLISGTQYVQGVQISRRISGLTLRRKSENIAGLQLADLITSPIGRYVLGKHSHEDWTIISSKFRSYRGSWRGAGLITLPKS